MARFKLISIILFVQNVEAGIYDLFNPEMRLNGFLMEKISPIGMEMCVKECSKRVSCASLNFNRGRLECELSHSDAASNPESMTPNSEYIHMERNQIPQQFFDACSASCLTRSTCVITATGPKCVKSDCPVRHPDVYSTKVNVTSTNIRTTLNYTCNLNSSIAFASTCKADGSWTSSALFCPEPFPKPPDCFESKDSCWYQFNFTYDTTFNGCPEGIRFVRRTQYSSAPFVGVVLCSPTRYKIMLGADLTGPFLNIGDGSGYGEDQCELVGGYQLGAVMANDYVNSPSVSGYQRFHWGEPFTIGTIGYSTTSYHYNSWHECGVSIPEAHQPACFKFTPSCWYEYNFAHDTTWNGCAGGRKYVMRTRFTSAPMVGVVLCNPTRYKIFLGANLTDTFLNVGDGDGEGGDFCELVGGLEENANLPGDYTIAPVLTGYARHDLGEEFDIRSIAGPSKWYCNSWYECGVQIPGPTEPDCMTATPPCWYAYNVWLDNSMNGCSGGQILVKRTNYTSAPFLAVQLCSSTRYKLFLGSSLGGQFMNIGDGVGNGENQCELVGGSENSAVTAGDHTFSPAVSGFFRSYIGQQFSYGAIGYAQSPYYFTSFLECGVSIPGTDTVV